MSRRDLPVLLLAGSRDGATTVASTMIIARLVLASWSLLPAASEGTPWGCSDDGHLRRPAGTGAYQRVAVVCAGAKSILDLKLTLEYLEHTECRFWAIRWMSSPPFTAAAVGCRSTAGWRCLRDRKSDESQVGVGPGGRTGRCQPHPEAYAMSEDTSTSPSAALLLRQPKG